MKENETMVIITITHFEDLVRKASAFDIIRDDIKSKIDAGARNDYEAVDDTLILGVTGMKVYKRMMNKNSEED